MFKPIVRSDTPCYAPSDRTLGLNTIVRTNFGVENFRRHILAHQHQQQHIIIINSSSISNIIITTITIIITIISTSTMSSNINIIITSASSSSSSSSSSSYSSSYYYYYFYPPPKTEGYSFSVVRPSVSPSVCVSGPANIFNSIGWNFVKLYTCVQ